MTKLKVHNSTVFKLCCTQYFYGRAPQFADAPLRVAMSALRLQAHRPHFTCVPLRSARGYQRSRKNSGKNKKGFFLINLQQQLPQPSVSTNSVNKIILHINYNQKFHEVQFINFFSFFSGNLDTKTILTAII